MANFSNIFGQIATGLISAIPVVGQFIAPVASSIIGDFTKPSVNLTSRKITSLPKARLKSLPKLPVRRTSALPSSNTLGQKIGATIGQLAVAGGAGYLGYTLGKKASPVAVTPSPVKPLAVPTAPASVVYGPNVSYGQPVSYQQPGSSLGTYVAPPNIIQVAPQPAISIPDPAFASETSPLGTAFFSDVASGIIPAPEQAAIDSPPSSSFEQSAVDALAVAFSGS